ncbi:MAG: hypothetical protein MJ058_09850 [Akkermansia sp.]|nr:hypothetical protein [Akkermansia sp.]
MRVAASRKAMLDSAVRTQAQVQGLVPDISSGYRTFKTLASMVGGALVAGAAARAVRKGAVIGARSGHPWLALLLQLGTTVAIPLLRRHLSGEPLLPAPDTAPAKHPLGAVGSCLNLPKIDLNPARAFYRWLGLEK